MAASFWQALTEGPEKAASGLGVIEESRSVTREQVSILNGQLANNLGGMATIKSFTTEAHEVSEPVSV